jgi:hypothetical protein
VDVLRRAGQHVRALAVVAGPLGQRFITLPRERASMALASAVAAGANADAAALARFFLRTVRHAPADVALDTCCASALTPAHVARTTGSHCNTT